MAHTESPETNTMSRPVIAVGSGLAGLAAAYEALRAGAASVHMLDRAAKPGGNSIKASSGINGAGTRFQRDKDIKNDDSARFYDDSVRSAGTSLGGGDAAALGKADREALIEMLTTRSAAAVDWLADEIGVDLTTVALLGGHSAARTHRGTTGPPPGAAIVGALLKKLGADPRFTLTSSAEVVSLITRDDDRAVTGVRYKTAEDGAVHDLLGPVVFAAGGFAGDTDGLLATHRPDLARMPSTNEARPAPHGLLTAVGAAFVDMDRVQVHPTGFVDPRDPRARYKFLAAEALRGEGGILLSSGEGRRFVNEMDRRDVVSDAIMNLSPAAVAAAGEDEDEGETQQYEVTLLLDPGASEAAGSHLSFYLFKGLMRKVKVRDLPPAAIEAVDRYAAAVAAGIDADFGRTSFGHWRLPAGEENRDQEVAVGTVTPVTHFTMGGVAFDTRACVLRRGEGGLVPIKGLWAAGEITGGVHGDNRLGGSSLLECAVFGRVAGAEAAEAAKADADAV
ncbi:putative aromatic-L-amino-acid decarboxylase [Rosellinia necatrix]|uniref:Fumarate reductase n=1 Tax=Rosellinia necatrix TaxID=77044 RepID=A0A1W2TTK9_ROSNE|nr:putative aromatic-L-amino-acid decarboxylase [Rosellinia necatrix]